MLRQQCCDMLRSNIVIVWPELTNAGPTMLGHVVLKCCDHSARALHVSRNGGSIPKKRFVTLGEADNHRREHLPRPVFLPESKPLLWELTGAGPLGEKGS